MDNICDNRDAAKFHDFIHSSGLRQYVFDPTYVKGHTLDLVLSRSTERSINNVCTTFNLPSDHGAITCDLHIPRPEPVKIKCSLRKLNDIDLDSFCSDILKSSLFSSPINDIHLLVDKFDYVLIDLRDNHVPLITRTVRCRPNTPWYNDELHDMKRESRRLERPWISCKLEIHKQLFKENCIKYNLAIKHAKETYHQKNLADCDSKHQFQKFDILCTQTSSKSLPSDIFDDELANRFSHFFRNKTQRIKQNLVHSDELDFSCFDSDKCDSSFSDFSLISEETVQNIIMKSAPQHVLLIQSQHGYWKSVSTNFCQ